jgi:uncharacterized membrane protein (UPF0127 family)
MLVGMKRIGTSGMIGTLRSLAGALIALVLFTLSPVVALPATFATESLTIRKADGSIHLFTVEVAAEPDQRAQGLMNRKEMAGDRGMLFDFGTTRRVYMWMKDTYLPLDMLFLGQDGTVVSITPDTVPLSEAIIDSHEPVRFVIELNAGAAKTLGLSVGDKAESPRIKAAPTNP